jgi:hypothetical protein
MAPSVLYTPRMSTSAGVDWGSVADWVSGLGSISAVITALYLSGAERRARRRDERPEIICDLDDSSPESRWVSMQIILNNSSRKAWRTTTIEVLSPKGGRVISADDIRNSSDAYGDVVDDLALRDANAARVSPFRREVASFGVPGPSWSPGSRGDRSHGWIHVQLPLRARHIELRLHLESLEPRPYRFSELIVRQLPR